jgi:hypothetical protein
MRLFLRRRNRRGDDRGVAIVEMALALPLLVGLAMGVLEFGMVFRNTNVLERSTSAGARIGSSVGPGPMADFEILQAINSTVSSASDLEVERVVIFNSTSADGSVPANCQGTSSQAGVCNVYNAGQVASANPAVGFARGGSPLTCVAGSWDSAWCPTTRNNDPQHGAVVYLGVHVEARLPAYTGLFGDEFVLRETSIFRLEPPSLTTPGGE